MNFEAVKSFITDKMQKELPTHLSYHNLEHMKDVYEAAEMLADMEGVGKEDRTLLLTAVLFHDAGFIVNREDHEEISCDIAKQHLPAFGYNDTQMQVICGMIMATKYPQSPHNLLEEIICDSDLDYLGRDDFFTTGKRLFYELTWYGIIHNENEWNHMQIEFLESHHYFTKSSVTLRRTKKNEHLQQIKAMVK